MTAENEPRRIAEAYAQAGLAPIPLKPRDKKPEGEWGKFDVHKDGFDKFRPDSNIGVKLGIPSGGLVDIDCDWPESRIVASKFLGMLPSFGRATARGSHRLCRVVGEFQTKKFVLPSSCKTLAGLPSEHALCVIEARGDGGQTMFPGSVHPNGERIEFEHRLENIPEINSDGLLKRVGLIAFLSVVLRFYPKQGSRDDMHMALAGTLAQIDMNAEDIDRINQFLAKEAQDEEAEKRGKGEQTLKRRDNGESFAGLPRLMEILGLPSECIKAFWGWLGRAVSEEDSDTILEEINSKFFVVENEGGRCRVGFFENRLFEHDQQRRVLMIQSFEDFSKRFMHKTVCTINAKGNAVSVPLGKFWLTHPLRRQYERIDFCPGREIEGNVLNLWQGFAVKPQKASWRRMLRHIWVVLAKRDGKAFRYILKWAAWAVQNPGRHAEVALVFRGGKGTGKGTFCRYLKNLFGQHGLQVYSAAHMTGRFNSHLRDCVVLFADEAVAPHDKDAESILKGYLTEPTLPIEAKGRDIIQAPNRLHVMMASNQDYVVPATGDERRFAIFDVSSEKAKNKDWFDALHKEMNEDGLAAMLHFLLSLQLGDWHPRNSIPQNNALTEQRKYALTGLKRVWFDWLHEGDAPGVTVGTGIRIVTEEIAKRAGCSVTSAGRFLKEMGCIQDRSIRPSGWITLPLREARKFWDHKEFPEVWDDKEDWCPPDFPPF